eukprot:TRINITY_DN1028_c0_g1_i1.p1 TRINITY_DN1028_c0_g1~~TRINITY_DN1028_c0_g1_i1.p1  ORF type:complete len:225 (-),score=32.59 TRINITY_DN1028_c0_g1_i1:50-724(-)
MSDTPTEAKDKQPEVTQPDTANTNGTESGDAQPAEDTTPLEPHPLQHEWALWYDCSGGRRPTANNWGDNIKRIVKFNTVEDFWRVFNNIKPASQLTAGSNYYLFRDPIEPKWEDKANKEGGKWLLNVNRGGRSSPLDQQWLWAVLACIGESFEHSEEVMGVVVNVRRNGDRVSVWTANAANEVAVKSIGVTLREALELPNTVSIGYSSHSDAMKTSKVPDRFTL